jgi:hypothetical protein
MCPGRESNPDYCYLATHGKYQQGKAKQFKSLVRISEQSRFLPFAPLFLDLRPNLQDFAKILAHPKSQHQPVVA